MIVSRNLLYSLFLYSVFILKSDALQYVVYHLDGSDGSGCDGQPEAVGTLIPSLPHA